MYFYVHENKHAPSTFHSKSLSNINLPNLFIKGTRAQSFGGVGKGWKVLIYKYNLDMSISEEM